MSGFEEELTAYIDGELPPERVAEVEAALSKDPALRTLERRLRQSVALVEALPHPEASPALRRAVLAAVEKPTFFETWFTLPRMIPLGLAAAATAVVVLSWPATPEEGAPLDEQNLLLAQNLEVLEAMDLVDLETTEDLDVVAALHELEVIR